MYRKCFFISFVLCLVLQCSAQTSKSNEFLNSLFKCGAKDGLEGVINCGSVKLLKNIDRLGRMETIQIAPGISLDSTGNSTGSRFGKTLQELPADPSEKSSALLSLLLESFAKFFTDRTLKIKLSSPGMMARALQEARAKDKKLFMGPLMGIGAKIISSMAIVVAGLGALALKALSVGSIALVISIILFIQYYYPKYSGVVPLGGNYNVYGYASGNTYPGGSNQIGPGFNPQYPYKRSFDQAPENIKNDPQELAYSAQSGH